MSPVINQSVDVLSAFESFADEEKTFPARTILWHAGDHAPDILLIKEGWCFRYNLLFDGRRQIFTLFTGGDLVSPRLIMMPQVSYSLQTIDRMTALTVKRDRLREALLKDENAREVFDRICYTQHVYYDQRMVELGRLNATEKICALLLRLVEKMDALGLGDNGTYKVPITREIISDLLGLTSVHVSRTMSVLQDEGAIQWDRGELQIFDLEKIRQALPKFYPAMTEISMRRIPRV